MFREMSAQPRCSEGNMIKFIVCSVLLFSALPPGSGQPSAGEDLYRGMRWRNIGPFRGGRVLAVAGSPGNSRVYYFGAAAGGVWKTEDAGLNWSPLWNHTSVSAIGSLAVAPSDPNILYAGTGEAIRGDISGGDGIYKSIDAGRTWKNMGLRDTRAISRVIVDPHDPKVVFLAALGHPFGTNSERGIFRSLDGGATWQKVLYRDDHTGGVDVAFDPNDPSVLFAALWEANRTPYSMTSGGPGSGLYRSADRGTTWQRLEGHGLPKGILGRIGVSVSAADSHRVYAVIEADENALYRSDDGGANWQMVNRDGHWVRPWYFNTVYADPKDANTVYMLNLGIYRSSDGGRKFTALLGTHGDHHSLWIDPADPRRMINGNDGGANVTYDTGRTWTGSDNQPTAQFYHVSTDNQFPYIVFGAQQDNSSVGIASRSNTGIIDERNWAPVGGGECGFIVADPRDPNFVIAGAQNGLFTRFDRRTGQAQIISPMADNARSHAAIDNPHRFQWTSPIAITAAEPDALYIAGEVVFKSLDSGMSWKIISPDLTRNDKAKQVSSGGVLTPDDSSSEYYDTIFALAPSPLDKDLIWAGSDDGLVHITRDGGKNWADITPKQMPEWSLVSMIDASPFDAGTAYMAVDRHRLDDDRPYIYKTTDFGKTWSEAVHGLPANNYVHAVRQDPKRKGLLYAGTDNGVFVSFDDGSRWQSLQLNLPSVPVYDLTVHGADLIAATHGRSFWILDDVAPLRELNESISGSAVYLYKPETALRVRVMGGGGGIGSRGNVGHNPPNGATIDYYLKAAPPGPVTLEIVDAQGKLARRFSSADRREGPPDPYNMTRQAGSRLPAEPGMNRFVWDLRYDNAREATGFSILELRQGGPLAMPGNYEVKLTAGGKTVTTALQVEPDPRVRATMADFEQQFHLAIQIRDRVNQAHDTVNQMRALLAQLKDRRDRLSAAGRANDAEAAQHLEHSITQVEGDIIQLKSTTTEASLVFPIMLDAKLAAIGDAVESADTAPTQQARDAFVEVGHRLDASLAKWKSIEDTELVEFNNLLKKANLAPIR